MLLQDAETTVHTMCHILLEQLTNQAYDWTQTLEKVNYIIWNGVGAGFTEDI